MVQLATRRLDRFADVSNAYLQDYERAARGVGDRIPDPDFGIHKDPDFWPKLDAFPAIRGAREYRRAVVAGDKTLLEAPTKRDAPLVPWVSAGLKHYKGFRTARRRLADADLVGRTTEKLYGESVKIDLLGDGREFDWFLVTGSRPQNKQRWELKREEYVDQAGDKQVRFLWAVRHIDLATGRGYWQVPDNPDEYIHHVVDDAEDTFGYGGTMARPLYWLSHAWFILDEALKDTCERYGSPWVMVKLEQVIGGLQSSGGEFLRSFSGVVSQLLNIVKILRANNVAVSDSRVSIQLIEAQLQGARLIREALDDLRNEARILILGSNLPTSATAGGSYSLADVQDESTRRLLGSSRDVLDDTLSEQLIVRWCRWNAPTLAKIPTDDGTGRTLADCAPPVLSIRDEERTKPDEENQRFNMALAARLRVREEDVRQITGFPAPAENEPAIDLGAAPAGGPGLFREPGSRPSWWEYARAV